MAETATADFTVPTTVDGFHFYYSLLQRQIEFAWLDKLVISRDLPKLRRQAANFTDRSRGQPSFSRAYHGGVPQPLIS